MRADRILAITVTAISRRNCTIQATSFTENCPTDAIPYSPGAFKAVAGQPCGQTRMAMHAATPRIAFRHFVSAHVGEIFPPEPPLHTTRGGSGGNISPGGPQVLSLPSLAGQGAVSRAVRPRQGTRFTPWRKRSRRGRTAQRGLQIPAGGRRGREGITFAELAAGGAKSMTGPRAAKRANIRPWRAFCPAA